jgi:hypothetical protein
VGASPVGIDAKLSFNANFLPLISQLSEQYNTQKADVVFFA